MALVQYKVDDDTQISVEVSDSKYVGKVVKGKAPKVFDLSEHLDSAQRTLMKVRDSLTAVATSMDEVKIETSITLGGETGVIFAKADAEATLKISLTWKPTAPSKQ